MQEQPVSPLLPTLLTEDVGRRDLKVVDPLLLLVRLEACYPRDFTDADDTYVGYGDAPAVVRFLVVQHVPPTVHYSVVSCQMARSPVNLAVPVNTQPGKRGRGCAQDRP